MLVLVVEPGKVPESRDISGDLSEMQSIVGGYIQAIYPFPGVALICNEEGWLPGPPGNRGLRDENGEVYDIICGTFFLCGAPEDSNYFMSLTEEQIQRYTEVFASLEVFLNLGGHTIILPCALIVEGGDC